MFIFIFWEVDLRNNQKCSFITVQAWPQVIFVTFYEAIIAFLVERFLDLFGKFHSPNRIVLLL